MKNIAVIALLISLAITSYLLWDTQQQLASTQDDALYFLELSNHASNLVLALTQYVNGEINKDSVLVINGYYERYLDSVNIRWEGKHEIHGHNQ